MPLSYSRARGAVSRMSKSEKRRIRRSLYKKQQRGNLLINRMGSKLNNGIPEEMFLKLKYTTENVTLNGLAGVPVNYFLRGNDLFDPDYTSTGHQPYYADQLCSLYSRYVVYASKIKTRIVPTSANPVTIVTRPTLTSAAVGNLELENERPDSKNAIATSDKPAIIKHYAKTKTVQGVKDLEDIIYHGSSSTSGPTSGPTGSGPWYWAIAAEGMANSAFTVYIQTEIVYYVRLFKRAIQSQS